MAIRLFAGGKSLQNSRFRGWTAGVGFVLCWGSAWTEGVVLLMGASRLPLIAPAAREIWLRETEYWVAFDGALYGPFDYRWCVDLAGIELTFRGVKYGEVGGGERVYADLSGSGLPLAVCRVAAVVFGGLVRALELGVSGDERISMLLDLLEAAEMTRYVIRDWPDGPISPGSDPADDPPPA